MAAFTGSDDLRGTEFVDAVERTWEATLARVAAMPAGTVDVSVGGEWSFAQTLRHLVLATDMWLGRAVLETEQPFHPLGLAYAEVLAARADRVAMVRDFLGTVTPETVG